MGGSEKMDIQMAPLMSKLQRAFLDNMLRGVIESVSDFPLGAGFPGYGPDMYSPRPFEYGKQGFSDWEQWQRSREDKDDDDVDDNGPPPKKATLASFVPVPSPGPPPPPGPVPPPIPPVPPPPGPPFIPPGPPPAPPMPPVPKPGPVPPPGPMPLSWFSMLNQQDPMAGIPQMLTSPFMDPWRYGLTGNYPRRV